MCLLLTKSFEKSTTKINKTAHWDKHKIISNSFLLLNNLLYGKKHTKSLKCSNKKSNFLLDLSALLGSSARSGNAVHPRKDHHHNHIYIYISFLISNSNTFKLLLESNRNLSHIYHKNVPAMLLILISSSSRV